MTDPRPPLTDDDLSAALDGEAGPDVLARLADDPAAQARLATLRSVGDALRAAPPAPLDPDTVDRLLARALAEADAASATDGPPAAADPSSAIAREPEGGAVVTPLAPARARRSAPPWLVAAVVAVLVAVGLGLVWSGRGGDDQGDTAATSFSDDAGSSGGGASAGSDDQESSARDDDASAERPSAGGSSAEEVPATTGGLRDLGEFPDEAALRSALATEALVGRSTTSSEALAADEIARCDTQMRHVFELADAPTATAVAALAGEDVLVLAYERVSFEDGSTPTTFVTVVDPTTCSPRLSFERDPG